MSKILVTGGAGFIGSHLVDALVDKHKVTVLDDLSVGKKVYINKKATFKKGKIQSITIQSFIEKGKFDIIYHLAAQKNLQYSKSHPVEDAETNIIGSLRLIDSAKKYGIKKFIFYSTAAVYDPKSKPPNKESETPNPATPYGVAKRVIEKYLEISDLPFTILRLSNVYGPRQDAEGEGGVVAIFCKSFAEGKAPHIYNSGKQTRDFVYVVDVVSASVRVMHVRWNGVVNISTNKETDINTLFTRLGSITKKPLEPRRGKKVPEQIRSRMSNSKAKRVLGWTPKTTLQVGLKQTYRIYE